MLKNIWKRKFWFWRKKPVINQAFVDGQNLSYGTRKAEKPWKIDLKRFRRYLKEKYHVETAYYFIGYYVEDLENLYSAIQEAGFILVFRKHNDKMDTAKKGNVDTDIVFTVMRKIADREKFDRVVLVSGDGDYYRMVEYLVKNGRFERLLAPDTHKMSSLYRVLDHKFYDNLGSQAIRAKIRYRKQTK